MGKAHVSRVPPLPRSRSRGAHLQLVQQQQQQRQLGPRGRARRHAAQPVAHAARGGLLGLHPAPAQRRAHCRCGGREREARRGKATPSVRPPPTPRLTPQVFPSGLAAQRVPGGGMEQKHGVMEESWCATQG